MFCGIYLKIGCDVFLSIDGETKGMEGLKDLALHKQPEAK